jgi:hypothetical protein
MANEMNKTINHWVVRSSEIGDTPETLWEAARKYFIWCENNPIYKEEMIRQTGEIVSAICPRPFNLPALCIHCGITPAFINDMARNPKAGNYYFVAQRILQVIYSQNLEYAMVGIFNPVIAAKKLNLGTQDEQGKTPATVNVEVITYAGQPGLADSEFEKSETASE